VSDHFGLSATKGDLALFISTLIIVVDVDALQLVESVYWMRLRYWTERPDFWVISSANRLASLTNRLASRNRTRSGRSRFWSHWRILLVTACCTALRSLTNVRSTAPTRCPCRRVRLKRVPASFCGDYEGKRLFCIF
jgi:hypothetical protein